MKGIDWKNITVSPKELIAAIIFTFTMSGVWYKITYASEQDKKDIISKYNSLNTDYLRYKETTEARIRVLEDDKTARDAINKALSEPGKFYPMTKVKHK